MRYIPPGQLYRSLYERLIQLLPNEVDSRLTNMVYLMLGIFLAKKVQTGVIATKVPLRVKRVSIIRRLERFWTTGRCGYWVGMKVWQSACYKPPPAVDGLP